MSSRKELLQKRFFNYFFIIGQWFLNWDACTDAYSSGCTQVLLKRYMLNILYYFLNKGSFSIFMLACIYLYVSQIVTMTLLYTF